MERLKSKFTFLLLFVVQLAFSQLSNFTLSVAKTDETCPNNGTLTFNVSNTTPGATIIYSVYLLPDVTTPISVQSANTLSGLNSGTYRVVATQSLGSQSGTQQQDIIITDLVVTLTYQLSSTREICGYDGTITVDTLTGTAVSYEIISGPVIKPLQSSNVFTGLTAGTYQIRVFDNCGEGVVQTYTLLQYDTAIDINLFSPSMASCTTVSVGFFFQQATPYPDGIIKFPLQVVTTVLPPGGGPAITYNQTILGGVNFSQIIPYYANQPYSYSFTITDGCGTVYTLNGIVNNLSLEAYYQILPDGCPYKLVRFFNVSAVTLVSAPSGFSTSLPISYTSLIVGNSVGIGGLIAGTYVFDTVDTCGVSETFTIEIVITPPPPPFYFVFNVTCTSGSLLIYDITQIIMTAAPASYGVALPHNYTSSINSSNYIAFDNLPVGTYVFDVLDLCGEPHVLTVVIAPVSVAPSLTILEGCQDGMGSVMLLGQFTSIALTVAPASYSVALPQNLLGNVFLGGTALVLDSLPPGNYVIHSVNSCNVQFDTNFTIVGHQDITNVEILPNCGSFDLNLNNSSTSGISTTYWLQELNTTTNNWGHPFTGVAYVEGTEPNPSNSISLFNNAINYNLAYQGHFRVLKVYNSYVSGSTTPTTCFKTVYEFDYSGLPRITDVYSISCGSTFEVVVVAEGFAPLIYRITTRNGQPFVVQNGNSNIFSGLIPATYNFQVEDACGNVLNNSFEISNPNPLAIEFNSITCSGENLTLSVPNFSFFQYEWWKDNNTSTILSTSSTLNFTPFTSNIHNGTYYVRITYSNSTSSCLNQVLSYTISINTTPPVAGQGNSYSYCGRQGSYDLFTLLQGSYDLNGTWTELTSSGSLVNNVWNDTGLPFGTYQFKYRVDGSCSLFAEAFVNITIKPIPQVPTATADTVICDEGSLHLYATNIPNTIYHWSGPNGFTSTDQNPIITNISSNNNGTYTVSVTLNGCVSGNSTVDVAVNPLPQFVLNQDCVDGDYVVTATPVGDSFNVNTAGYQWAGPDNYSASQNPIVITRGETGIYSLTVTDGNGCAVTEAIDVIRTICFIPNVITPNDDFSNDSFNLTGFEVDKIEIYNRWGRKVYEKNNYTNEWHGQNMQGERLPDSTYYYILNFRTGENKAGWIFISAND